MFKTRLSGESSKIKHDVVVCLSEVFIKCEKFASGGKEKSLGLKSISFFLTTTETLLNTIIHLL